MDFSKTLYYEAYSNSDGWHWKIYHYDTSGNKEVVVHRSSEGYDDANSAEDACAIYMDEHDIDATLS